MKLLLASLALFFTTTVFAVPEKPEKIIPMHELKALSIALRHLTTRADYNDEQRKVENYHAWITACSEKTILVEFVAELRSPDDVSNKGGNYDYARSTSYEIEIGSWRIVKIAGSK